MKIASFNIQKFGVNKISNKEVLSTIIKIVSRYDIILILEVVDANGKAVEKFVTELNNFESIYQSAGTIRHLALKIKSRSFHQFTENIMILGDFNADGDYVSNRKMKKISLKTEPGFHWLIGDDVDTTVNTGNDNTYDRIVIYGDDMLEAVVPHSAKPFNFQEAYGLDIELISGRYRSDVLVTRSYCSQSPKDPPSKPPLLQTSMNTLQKVTEVGKQFGQNTAKQIAASTNLLWARYEEFVGLNEVREAQNKVTEAEKEFMVARGIVRESHESLETLQVKLKEVRDRLDRVSREEAHYLELATLEHKLLQVRERGAPCGDTGIQTAAGEGEGSTLWGYRHTNCCR
ncbi:UNVERIFIED_CONTAM: hypothetical protein FKN15_023293 [Acipenser sinensis]